jgi:formate dehydrogenase alpha subunit
MTNPIGDVEKAKAILITGSNTTENHPVLSCYAKRAARFADAKIIVADPRKIPMVRHSVLWMRQKLGTDVAWINGMIHVIIRDKLYDEKYVKTRTVGFDDLAKTVGKYTPEFVEGITGIPAEDIEEAARIFAKAKSASILYTMGITQHICGTDNVKSLANLAMITGNVGREGGGVNPLRGQNNVQGACDMGGLPNVYTGYQPVANADNKKKFEEAWGVTGLNEKPGMTATRMLPAAHEGKLKALYIIGENPMVSDPDIDHAKACLEHLDFLVVQDIFLTETAQLAHVVLPSACFAEKDGTFSNTERKIQRVRKAVNPPGQAKDDWWILVELARRMGYTMNYAHSRAIFEEIARVTPSYCGVSYDRLEHDGLHWPCPGPDHPGTPCLHKEQFTCGLGVLHAVEWIPPAEQPDDQYPYYLTTGRHIYHYHTGTMTMKSDGLNKAAPECYLEITPADAKGLGVADGEMVEVKSRRGAITVKARVCDATEDGTVFLPFHYAKAAANKLTNTALDPIAAIPELKVCAVSISKTA